MNQQSMTAGQFIDKLAESGTVKVHELLPKVVETISDTKGSVTGAVRESVPKVQVKVSEVLTAAGDAVASDDSVKDKAAMIIAAASGQAAKPSHRGRWTIITVGGVVVVGAAALAGAKLLQARRAQSEQLTWPPYESPTGAVPADQVEETVAKAKESMAHTTGNGFGSEPKSAAETADEARAQVTDITDASRDRAEQTLGGDGMSSL